mmetsp:Transcript_100316/g.286957  ORF Transcript_100316/g.286957 Transcript_100316/m.286957 type:complete len:267 (-) Transcript_100316:1284-2084(-)
MAVLAGGAPPRNQGALWPRVRCCSGGSLELEGHGALLQHSLRLTRPTRALSHGEDLHVGAHVKRIGCFAPVAVDEDDTVAGGDKPGFLRRANCLGTEQAHACALLERVGGGLKHDGGDAAVQLKTPRDLWIVAERNHRHIRLVTSNGAWNGSRHGDANDALNRQTALGRSADRAGGDGIEFAVNILAHQALRRTTAKVQHFFVALAILRVLDAIGLAENTLHGANARNGILPSRRLTRKHDGIGPVQHGGAHIGDLSTSGPRLAHH